MKRLAIVLLAAAMAACSAKEIPYEEEIAAWRAQKDEFMRTSGESPVLPEQRASFPPLTYYAISEEYRIPASLKLVESKDVLELPTSTGLRRQMRRVGTLEFTLKGQALSLTAFNDAAEADMRRLFVPFGDLTNGGETYTGGRYLELDRTSTNIYDLDFNRAYLPFCVYNASYDCPLPPRENRLKLPVRAGERLSGATPSAGDGR